MNNKKVSFAEGVTTHSYKSAGGGGSTTKTMEIEEFMVSMINNYVTHYKKVNGKKDDFTLLDGINFNDMTSTNAPLEKFYEEMLKYKTNENKSPEYTKIYEYSKRDEMKIDDELYGIIQNGKPLLLSTSFFSLLIELTNLQNETDNKANYDIVSLK
jgi:hypothetical protein